VSCIAFGLPFYGNTALKQKILLKFFMKSSVKYYLCTVYTYSSINNICDLVSFVRFFESV